MGAIEYVQPSDWVTLKWRPAILNVPVRGAPVVGATVKVTAAEPVPFGFEVIEIQPAEDEAVHVQRELEARTLTLPEPPVWAKDAEESDSSNRHSAAACVTCARWPFTITPPLRATGSPFAVALNWTAPSPWPLVPAVMLSQFTSGWAVH